MAIIHICIARSLANDRKAKGLLGFGDVKYQGPKKKHDKFWLKRKLFKFLVFAFILYNMLCILYLF